MKSRKKSKKKTKHLPRVSASELREVCRRRLHRPSYYSDGSYTVRLLQGLTVTHYPKPDVATELVRVLRRFG